MKKGLEREGSAGMKRRRQKPLRSREDGEPMVKDKKKEGAGGERKRYGRQYSFFSLLEASPSHLVPYSRCEEKSHGQGLTVSDKEMVFNGSRSIGVEYFFRHFENVAKADASWGGKARPIIKYVRALNFQSYFQKFAVRKELTENAKSYEVVKTPLKKEFGSKRDMQEFIEAAISMKITLEMIS